MNGSFASRVFRDVAMTRWGRKVALQTRPAQIIRLGKGRRGPLVQRRAAGTISPVPGWAFSTSPEGPTWGRERLDSLGASP